jgi:hypothetical protein
MRPVLVLVVAVPVFALIVAGCGGGSSPQVASVASPAAPAPTTPTTTTQPGSGLAGGGSTGGPRGGNGNATVIAVGNAAQGAKFAACMRSHGLPNFPDPDAQGNIQFGSAEGIDPRSPKFRSALTPCRTLLPHLGPPTAAQLAQVEEQLLAFAKCMRARGIADFPDPSGAGLPLTRPHGDLDPNSPRFQADYRACKNHLPAGLPGKALGGLAPPAPAGG